MAKIILLLLLVAPLAQAAPFEDFKFLSGQRWDLGAEFGFYKSDGNFDKSGNTFKRHLDGYSYQTMNLDLSLRTGLGPRWNVYGKTRLSSAEAKTLSTGFPQTKSATGISDFQIGTDNLLYSGSLMVFSDFSFTFPMAKTERAGTSDVALGEGTMELEGRILLRVERKSYRFGAFGGVTYRDQGRSMLVPYGFLAEMGFGNWNFGTDLRGYQALTQDKDSNNEFAIDAAYFCPVNGCAKQYGAFNPSILQNNLWARVNLGQELGIHAGLSHDILGSNVSKGVNFYTGLLYKWGPHKKSSEPVETENFNEAIDDGIDQKPFEKVNVLKGAPPKSAPQRAQPPKVNLQDELNKTEQMMEKNGN